MKRPFISLCLPIFNRYELLKVSLGYNLEVLNRSRYKKDIEVVISDNASSQDIKNLVKFYVELYPDITIIYSRNNKNIGMANNILKTVTLSTGQYCWIIGSDDFILQDQIDKLLDFIIYNRPELCSINYGHIKINNYTDIIDDIEQMNWTKNNRLNKSSTKLSFDDLIRPKYNNVYLGAIMGNIFLRELWLSSSISNIYVDENFVDLESIYPHCFIFGEKFINSNCSFYSNIAILAGDGVREWTTDYWKSDLPFIEIEVINLMINHYAKNGLSKMVAKKALNHQSKRIGTLFFDLLNQKNFKYKNSDTILSIKKTFLKNSKYPKFWIGIIYGVYYKIKKYIRST